MTHSTPKIEMLPVAALKPYPGNARKHSKKQVRQIADSISRFGFTNPVLIGDGGEIVAGHGRVMAAKELDLKEVPTVRLSHLSPEERRAYVLADNKLALNAGWDTEILAIELQALIDIDFDVELKHIIERFDRAEREMRQEREKEIESAEKYVAWAHELFAEAEKNGEALPDILPHPDDVIIDPESGVRVIGPMNKEEAAKLEETIKLRDLHIMQHVYEERQCDDLDGPDRPGTALLIAMLLDRALPPRLRLRDFEMQMRMWPYQGMTKRKLLKELHRSWREIGAPRPRGWTYPPQWWGEKFFAALFDMVAEISSGEGDGTGYIDPLNAILREGFGRKKAA